MAQERPSSEPRELKFGGEKTESIKRGFAITTLRNPRPSYDFRLGEVILANCFDDGEKVPVVILANEKIELENFSISQLALDGFFSPEQAAEEMRSWPGYEATTTKSKMQAITFVSNEGYQNYSPFRQNSMLHETFGTLVHDVDLRQLFFPTMCFNLVARGGQMKDWVKFLRTNNLISKSEEDFLRNARFKGRSEKLFDYYQKHPKELRHLSTRFESSLFDPIILALNYSPDVEVSE